MNFIVILEELETVCLVPSLRNDIERDLSTNEIDKVVLWELFLEHFNHLLTNMMLLIVKAERITLLLRTVATHGTNVHHSGAELDERSSLHGNVQITEIAQDKIDKSVQLLVGVHIRDILFVISAKKAYCLVELDSIVIRGKTVLGEDILDFIGN